jgi:hypothetical protein
MGLRDPKCKTAICVQTKRFKWKTAILFKLTRIHSFGFQRFKWKTAICATKTHPWLGLRDPNASSVQTKNHLFGFDRFECNSVHTNKFTHFCLRDFQCKTWKIGKQLWNMFSGDIIGLPFCLIFLLTSSLGHGVLGLWGSGKTTRNLGISSTWRRFSLNPVNAMQIN